MAETLELQDIQGLVARGYVDLPAARYLLFRIEDSAVARNGLRTIADQITTSERRPGATATNLAITRSGLQRIGLSLSLLGKFSSEFLEGITTPHRSRILGDVDDSAPEHWSWGGSEDPPVDVMVMLYAKDQPALEELATATVAALHGGGFVRVQTLDTVDLGGKEQFGFHDGVSQPTIEGLSSRADLATNTVKAGEFILGYANEYGFAMDPVPVDPVVDPGNVLAAADGSRDLSKNGTYLVFRQLEQDVVGFWRFMREQTRRADGAEDHDAATMLAAKMVGRWPSGAPLVLSPDHDDAAFANSNDFMYFKADPDGLMCPIGSHVRRSNPRDSLDPKPGTEQSIATNKHHRLLRRGREYGTPVTDAELHGAPPATGGGSSSRGLQFICLAANISRQFEFIQHTWMNNATFDGLYDDADPLVGPHGSSGATFTVQSEPVACRYEGLPRFISVRGGAYFFLPGLRALRYLAELG